MDGKGGGGGLRGGCQELVSKVGLHWDSWRGDGHIDSSLPLRNIAFPLFSYLEVSSSWS